MFARPPPPLLSVSLFGFCRRPSISPLCRRWQSVWSSQLSLSSAPGACWMTTPDRLVLVFSRVCFVWQHRVRTSCPTALGRCSPHHAESLYTCVRDRLGEHVVIVEYYPPAIDVACTLLYAPAHIYDSSVFAPRTWSSCNPSVGGRRQEPHRIVAFSALFLTSFAQLPSSHPIENKRHSSELFVIGAGTQYL